MNNFETEIKVDTQKIVLSSESEIQKTENFVSQTKYLCDIDFFVSKIAEGIIKEFPRFFNQKFVDKRENFDSFKIETSDKAFSFLIKFGFQLENCEQKNIIFYQFISGDKNIHQNDERVKNYLISHKIFVCKLSHTKDYFENDNFLKLYKISNAYGIDFPELSKEQLSLVEKSDENIVVQGVAGSGKTNVCIDKLIYVACKNYGGRVLYTTFSRGLVIDTKLKVEAFINTLKNFVLSAENNQLIFVDENHKKAIEKKLGIFFFVNDDDKIIEKIKNIILFLNTKVDYFLLGDIYKKNTNSDEQIADERFFVENYVKNIKNHQLFGKLKSIKNLSYELVYKEIFGLIFGFCDLNDFSKRLSVEEYVNLRENYFSKAQCETIFQIARDYKANLQKNNMIDNNLICEKLLPSIDNLPKYSLSIIDEVQDFTQLNLYFIKSLALKVFCTGDALQMINPSYFSFGYLKNLLYKKEIASVAELKNNYRNTQKIQQIIDELGKINIEEFGTHNFVLSGKSVNTAIKTMAIFCNENIEKNIANEKFENFTVIVATKQKKEELRNILKNQEILTVAEIKGLERNTVVLFDILSDNFEKWQMLSKIKNNKKQADENSVYRYYFNLFYVGISRAKQNLFVVENNVPNLFKNLFINQFECLNANKTVEKLASIVSKVEFTEEELLQRIEQFLRLEQFDNAKWTANKLGDDKKKNAIIAKIDIYQNYVHFGKFREAGIKFWELGDINEAKKQFMLSGDATLIDLIDAVSHNSNEKLDIEIVKYFTDVSSNEIAKKFIIETVEKDLSNLIETQKNVHKKFLEIKENKNGK